MTSTDPFPGPLVDNIWLAAHLDDVALADVRWSMGDGPKRSDFEQGHLPGAVFVDLDTDLSDPPGDRGRHPLPTVAAFRSALATLGLLGRPVVCYDDTSGATASRLWWMLTTLGFPAAVLDGGVLTWPGPWEQGKPPNRPTTRSDGPPPNLQPNDDGQWPRQAVVEVDMLLDEISGGSPLLDARSHSRFLGHPNDIDPTPGHVPGAYSRPWTDNVGTDGKLLPPDELKEQFSRLGVNESTEWLASCGSGVTACHNIWSGTVAGLRRGRLYPGSWSEWIRDSSRPVHTGEDKAEGWPR